MEDEDAHAPTARMWEPELRHRGEIILLYVFPLFPIPFLCLILSLFGGMKSLHYVYMKSTHKKSDNGETEEFVTGKYAARVPSLSLLIPVCDSQVESLA